MPGASVMDNSKFMLFKVSKSVDSESFPHRVIRINRPVPKAVASKMNLTVHFTRLGLDEECTYAFTPVEGGIMQPSPKSACKMVAEASLPASNVNTWRA